MSRAALAPILHHVRATPLRTWSIIVTIFGDAILPRGGSVWLGTLLAFFESLDVAEGVVRTAVSRLTTDGWLERNRVGRNSFYHLGQRGRDVFHRAGEQIYRAHAPAWAGYLDMLLLDGNASDEATRTALREAGFACSGPGTWMAPGGTVAPPGITGALALRSTSDLPTLLALALRCWPLEKLASSYLQFLAAFEPLRASVDDDPPLTDREAMFARVLLIHQYRRIALADPILPPALLPMNWPGTAARALCSQLYPRLLPASERWLDQNALNEAGKLPPATGVFARFVEGSPARGSC